MKEEGRDQDGMKETDDFHSGYLEGVTCSHWHYHAASGGHFDTGSPDRIKRLQILVKQHCLHFHTKRALTFFTETADGCRADPAEAHDTPGVKGVSKSRSRETKGATVDSRPFRVRKPRGEATNW